MTFLSIFIQNMEKIKMDKSLESMRIDTRQKIEHMESLMRNLIDKTLKKNTEFFI